MQNACPDKSKSVTSKTTPYSHNVTTTSAAVTTAASSVIDTTTNSKYFQNAFINGKLVKAYVDPGSAVNMMPTSTAQESKIMYSSPKSLVRIHGFGKGYVVSIGVLTANLKVD